MSNHTLFEENGYFAWAVAAELPNGKWEAFVFFERKVNHARPVVPAVKHRLITEFGSRDEATSEAGAWALERMQKNETKLELCGDWYEMGNG
ncbi:hypothetical protein PQQ96_25425 [Paraburkholderia sediminicola]|uniref:hypothetical protein n=1 Tax=Paraburkholderia sediminicola TaxID=458836 RepID=UPI0038BDA8AF